MIIGCCWNFQLSPLSFWFPLLHFKDDEDENMFGVLARKNNIGLFLFFKLTKKIKAFFFSSLELLLVPSYFTLNVTVRIGILILQ